MNEKLCIFCQYFDLDMGEPGYSELTPGANANIGCGKDHWDMSNYGDTREFRENIIRASICNDYYPVDPNK